MDIMITPRVDFIKPDGIVETISDVGEITTHEEMDAKLTLMMIKLIDKSDKLIDAGNELLTVSMTVSLLINGVLQ